MMGALRKRGYRFITLERETGGGSAETRLGIRPIACPTHLLERKAAAGLSIGQSRKARFRRAPAFPQWVIARSKVLHLPTGQVTAPTLYRKHPVESARTGAQVHQLPARILGTMSGRLLLEA